MAKAKQESWLAPALGTSAGVSARPDRVQAVHLGRKTQQASSAVQPGASSRGIPRKRCCQEGRQDPPGSQKKGSMRGAKQSEPK